MLGGGRFGTDPVGFGAMLARAEQWLDRAQAVEGCEGIGKHLVLRLSGAGETVIDVPAKLSARMRVYATGLGRKTDDTDAHSIALAGVRMTGLRHVASDESLEVLRLLADRRRRIGEDHTRMVCQLHVLLLELLPGGAKKDLSAAQARVVTISPARPFSGHNRVVLSVGSLDSRAVAEPRQRPRGRRRGWLIFWALLGVTVLALAGGVTTVLTTGRAFTEPSTSMANAIRPGDVVVVARTTQVHRGDVIVEQQTSPALGDYVRRVIGLPGDHVACCDARGRITVNGKLLNESYVYPRRCAL